MTTDGAGVTGLSVCRVCGYQAATSDGYCLDCLPPVEIDADEFEAAKRDPRVARFLLASDAYVAEHDLQPEDF